MLQTIVVEIEAILNDRSLTYVSPDFEDDKPLTPAHALYGRRITSLPYPITEVDEMDDSNYGDEAGMQRNTKHLLLLLQHFWKC